MNVKEHPFFHFQRQMLGSTLSELLRDLIHDSEEYLEFLFNTFCNLIRKEYFRNSKDKKGIRPVMFEKYEKRFLNQKERNHDIMKLMFENTTFKLWDAFQFQKNKEKIEINHKQIQDQYEEVLKRARDAALRFWITEMKKRYLKEEKRVIKNYKEKVVNNLRRVPSLQDRLNILCRFEKDLVYFESKVEKMRNKMSDFSEIFDPVSENISFSSIESSEEMQSNFLERKEANEIFQTYLEHQVDF